LKILTCPSSKKYIEQVRDNRSVQAFLAGVNAA
jgi:hypothetical protein